MWHILPLVCREIPLTVRRGSMSLNLAQAELLVIVMLAVDPPAAHTGWNKKKFTLVRLYV